MHLERLLGASGLETRSKRFAQLLLACGRELLDSLQSWLTKSPKLGLTASNSLQFDLYAARSLRSGGYPKKLTMSARTSYGKV